MRLFDAGFTRRQLSGQLIGFLCWLFVTAVAILLTPDPSGHGTHTQLGLPPCPSVLLFDRPCPGCGLTTSITSTVQGRLAHGFDAHPLGPPLYLGFSAYAMLGIWGWAKGWRLRSDSRLANRALAAVAVTFLAFGVLRAAAHPGYAASPEHRFVLRLLGR